MSPTYRMAGNRCVETNTAISEEDWIKKGIELFGEDREKWRFHCPSCHNELSIEEARTKFASLEGCGWHPVSECIGRYTRDAGCDWCAYGLFSGPLFVKRDDETVTPVFDFAGQPFTKKEAED
jgi:hypothetical protein